MAMSEEFEKLHPILQEVSNTLTELYQQRRDEETRQKLIMLERILQEHLEKIRDSRTKLENQEH